MQSIDTTLVGRKTYDVSLQMGATFDSKTRGEIIASFLDVGAIDEFIISVIPTFIGDGIPLIARRHRHVPLRLRSVEPFPDGVVQLRYGVQQADQ